MRCIDCGIIIRNFLKECEFVVVYALEHPEARHLAYRLLAYGANFHWGLAPLPEMERGAHGKPFFPGHPQYQFNVSHSGNFALCALDGAPVGADIQVVRPCRAALLDQVCSPGERDWLRQRGDSQAAFAQLWCMKESRCKYSGMGLRRPISAISVPLPEHGEEKLERDGLRFYLKNGGLWQMCLCGTSTWDGTIHWLRDIAEDEEG